MAVSRQPMDKISGADVCRLLKYLSFKVRFKICLLPVLVITVHVFIFSAWLDGSRVTGRDPHLRIDIQVNPRIHLYPRLPR
jgi:hypothetical protein